MAWTSDEEKQIRQALGITGAKLATELGDLQRAVALSFENAVRDDVVYTNSQMDSAYWYCYDSKTNAELHDKSTGLVAKYKEVYTYTGGKVDTITITLEP